MWWKQRSGLADFFAQRGGNVAESKVLGAGRSLSVKSDGGQALVRIFMDGTKLPRIHP